MKPFWKDTQGWRPGGQTHILSFSLGKLGGTEWNESEVSHTWE